MVKILSRTRLKESFVGDGNGTVIIETDKDPSLDDGVKSSWPSLCLAPDGVYFKEGPTNYDWTPLSTGGTKGVYSEVFELNSQQIFEGKIILSREPNTSNFYPRFLPRHGIEQHPEGNFYVNKNEIIFKGLGLDGFLEVGDIIKIIYST